MNDKQIDDLIDRALREEQALPEGLSERLESYIDQLAETEKAKKTPLHRGSAYWLTAVAASLLIGVALFFPADIFDRRATTADTFSDPEEAAIAAEEALVFLSTQFNKGIEQIEGARQEVETVNEIVNKQINKINKK